MPQPARFDQPNEYTLRLEERAAWQAIQLEDLRNSNLSLREELEAALAQIYRQGIESQIKRPQ